MLDLISLYLTGPPSDCRDVQYVRFSTKSFEDIAMDYLFGKNAEELVPAMFSMALLNTNATAAVNASTNCSAKPQYVKRMDRDSYYWPNLCCYRGLVDIENNWNRIECIICEQGPVGSFESFSQNLPSADILIEEQKLHVSSKIFHVWLIGIITINSSL